ncbi:aspartic-type endopeptidase [Seiridium cupressi]
MNVQGAVRGQWSNRTLGPDGPWNALEVTMGENQAVTIYGGKMWESFFLSSSYCSSTTTGNDRCYAAEKSAIYYEKQGTGSTMGISFDPPEFWTDHMEVKGSGSSRWADDLYLSTDTSQWGLGAIPNISMALLDDEQLVYPNGNSYPLFAGCLSFGSALNAINQTFMVTAGTLAGAKNSSLLSGYLSSQDKIDSNSFGMHIGTGATPAMAGSLWFGGYDQNRVLNDVLAVPIEPEYFSYSVEISDISITTLTGESPFSFTKKSGLLSLGNTTIGNSLAVAVEPCIPYMNLPKSTCDAIATNLPVTYNEGLGLYFWNTGSEDYKRIVSSAAALTFSFSDPDNNSRIVNISLPFRHLNLTLEEPLVSTPTPYFPCNAASPGYSLGRAFLQDSFFGANFEDAVMYLAQAPGPNVRTENIVNINGNGTIAASHNDLVKSWDDFWSLDGETTANWTTTSTDGSTGGSTNGTTSSSEVPVTESSKTPLIAGLAAGLGGAIVLMAVAFLFFWRRRRQDQDHTAGTSQQNNPILPSYYEPEYPESSPSELAMQQAPELSGFPRAELSAGTPQFEHQYQLPGQYETSHEMPAEGTSPPGRQGQYGFYGGGPQTDYHSAEPTHNGIGSTYVSSVANHNAGLAAQGPGHYGYSGGGGGHDHS